VKINAGEISLADYGARLSDARSTARNIRLDRIEGSRETLRREQQYAIVYRREAGTVGIGYEQSPVGKSNATHSSQKRIGCAWLLSGKRRLANDQPRTLAGDEIGGQAHTGTQ